MKRGRQIVPVQGHDNNDSSDKEPEDKPEPEASSGACYEHSDPEEADESAITVEEDHNGSTG